MKKYLLRIGAILLAVGFSAFTPKKTLDKTFLLLSSPNAANVVANETNWETDGLTYGQCPTAGTDLACRVKLNSSTMSAFYHETSSGSGEYVLNDYTYATAIDGQGQQLHPNAKWMEINESIGNFPYRIINSIWFSDGSHTPGSAGDYDYLNAHQ